MRYTIAVVVKVMVTGLAFLSDGEGEEGEEEEEEGKEGGGRGGGG